MATPYSDVYDFFLSKVSEYSFLSLNQADLEAQLFKYLRSAIVDFVKPKIDLTRDDVNQQFNNTLNDDEKEVLATWMLYHFIKPKVLSSENYKQMMSDSDFKIYSQANHLQALQSLMKTTKTDAEKLNTKYSYKERDLRNITDKSLMTTEGSADGVIPPYDWYLYDN